MKTPNTEKLKSIPQAVNGKIRGLMKQTVRILSLVIMAGLAYKGVESLWSGKPTIGGLFAWLVILLLLYANKV